MRVIFTFVILLTGVAAAAAQTEQVVVTADPVHLLDGAPSEAATGLALPLSQTPRAATEVNDVTLSRYGITGLDSLTAITPSAYTASFYGVEGAVNLRGTLAENYFRGFKRAENRGTYDTPLTGAGDLTILRGPPSPVFGAGKVGGLVDFEPLGQGGVAGGDVTLTYGAYEKRNLAADVGTPFTVAGAQGFVRAGGEIDDSFSFYRGLHPSHQSLALSGDLAAGDWSFSANYLFHHADGEIQTPGWNRLTQNLIDSGTYITGRNTSLKDADGNGRLTLNELGGNPYTFDPNFRPLYIAAPGCGTCSDPTHVLDSGFGTTTISRRTVYLAPGVDFSRTTTHTGFVEAARALEDGDSLRLQLFTDILGNDRFVSYGYPASTRTEIGEARLRYDFARTAGVLTMHAVVGASWRLVHAIEKESYNSGVIALDRRDISQGPAANDIIDSPFNVDPPGAVGLGWENNVTSNTSDAGLFAESDIAWDQLHLLLGGRYDLYNARSVDSGVLAFEPPGGQGNAGRFTGSASLSWQSDSGVTPYLTHAQNSALEIGQGSEIPTALLAAKDWLSNSTLDEAGVKFTALDHRLEGSFDLYHQSRTQLVETSGIHVIGTSNQGAELELRWVLDDHISATLAASLAHARVKGPDQSFAYIPARDAGVSPQNGFGGAYVVYDFSTLVGRGDYENTLMPHFVASPYLTYTGANGLWGASLGATYVGRTLQTVPDPIVFPAYATLNASAFMRWGNWRLALNIDNALDERFFTPDADTYANLGALPGIGRTWRVALARAF